MRASWFLKIARARELIDQLGSEWSAFDKFRPYDIEFAPDGRGWVEVRGVVREIEEQRREHIVQLVGDILFNLRASLDHAAYHLAGSSANSETEFPIFRSKTEFLKLTPTGEPARHSGLAKMRGFPARAQKIVEQVQPYNRTDISPTDDPLWLLHELNNQDKHRAVHVTAAALYDIDLSLLGPGAARKRIARIANKPFENGTVLHRLRGTPERQIVHAHYVFSLAFPATGPGRGKLVHFLLKDMYDHIRDNVLKNLGPWL